MTDRRHLVVVGASLAGLRAVEAARRHGFEGSITLIGSESHLPYDRPPLSKEYLVDATPPSVELRAREALDDLDVELVLGRRATGLDLADRRVRIEDAAGPGSVSFDRLVIATGARPRVLPGSDGLLGVHALRTLDDARALRAALDSGPRRVVVIGAGFIGSEVASAARARGLDVTIIEAERHPLSRALGPELGSVCSRLHERHGTELSTGVGVAGLEGDGKVEEVRLQDGSRVDADLVVVGIGAIPEVDWLRGSGIEVDDGVLCTATLSTSHDAVYAAGDVARWLNPLFGRAMRLEHWTSAGEQGAVAAVNALSPDDARPYSTVPYFWSDWYGSRLQFVGIAGADEHRIVSGSVDEGRLIALYREDDRLVGALTLNEPAATTLYRRLISRAAPWEESVALAEGRGASARG